MQSTDKQLYQGVQRSIAGRAGHVCCSMISFSLNYTIEVNPEGIGGYCDRTRREGAGRQGAGRLHSKQDVCERFPPRDQVP